MYGFFAMLRREKYIRRWSLMRSANEESVSEHAYETAVLAHALATIGNRFYGESLPAEKIAAAALYHDATEVITGDMPTPVKYHNTALRQKYGEMEAESRRRLLTMLPPALREDYRAMLSMEEDDPEMYRYIKAADKLSAYIRCLEETNGGNHEFASAKETTLASLRALHMPEVDYFLTHFAGAYGENLDELTCGAVDK